MPALSKRARCPMLATSPHPRPNWQRKNEYAVEQWMGDSAHDLALAVKRSEWGSRARIGPEAGADRLFDPNCPQKCATINQSYYLEVANGVCVSCTHPERVWNETQASGRQNSGGDF